MHKKPKTFIFFILLPLAMAVLAVIPWVGATKPAWNVIFRPFAADIDAVIFWQIRIPRVLLSFLAGMGLSLGGTVFQALFRNPLATPYTLGVAGGASLGVSLSIFFGLHFSILGITSASLASLLGALASICLVYGMARISGKLTPNTILLGGVAIGFFFSSVILLLQYLSDLESSFRIIRWLLGDLSRANADSVLQVLPFMFGGVLITSFLYRELNLLSVDDDWAASRGVAVEPVRIMLFFGVSLMIGGIVTICGPIGFVGIMAPHVCRMVVGANHQYLIPASLFFGGIFLTLCDTLGRVMTHGAEVPVGIITAILGGPFFLWMLFKKDARVD